MPIKFTIIVTTYGARLEDLLKPCLNSIKNFTDLSNCEVLVVANGVTDNTREFVESLGDPFRCIWYDEALGYARACNRGMEQAKGTYVILLNNDTVILESQKNTWLDMLEEPFLRDPLMSCTGPMMAWSESARDFFIIGFCTMFKKSNLDIIGLYDEDFGAYGEDTDINLRAKKLGYHYEQVPNKDIRRSSEKLVIGVGDFPIWHKGNESYRNWPGSDELFKKNNNILFQKHGQYNPDIERAIGLNGYMNTWELKWLGDKAKSHKKILELGSWHGKSSRAIADNLSEDGVLYCVDHFNGSPEEGGGHDSAREMSGDHAFFNFCQNNADLIQSGKIIPIRMKSENAARMFKEQNVKFDMVFIDGSHTYEAVCQDIDIWKDLLTDDGLFSGHDYSAWYGATRAVDEKINNPKVDSPTTIWYCDKSDIKDCQPSDVTAIRPKSDIAGFMSDTELKWLGEHAKERKTIVEIGSWQGKSSNTIANNLPDNGVLFCIDTWAGFPNDPYGKLENADEIFTAFCNNNFDLIQSGKIIPIRMNSENAARFFKEQNIKADMIFIDGGHYYEEVSQDIDNWKNVLSDDGLFCGHDYRQNSPEHSGVIKAVDEKISNFKVGKDTTIWYCGKSDVKLPKSQVFDCFPYHNEDAILEVRLATLYDVVDRFIIVESTRTHQNQPKELNFEKNLKRFEKYLHKITYLVVDDFPHTDSWSLERRQRDRIIEGLKDCKDNDIIIISDCDEIPNPEAIKNYKIEDGIKSLDMNFYYYNFNCKSEKNWHEAKILPYKLLKQNSPCWARYQQCEMILNGGWHFSYFANIDGIIKKLGDFAHIEYATTEYMDRNRVEKAIKEGLDLFGRDEKFKYVELDNTLPKYVLDNIDGYKEKGLIIQTSN